MSIDYVIDSHTSVFIVGTIWTFYVMCSLTYASLFQSTVSTTCEREQQEMKRVAGISSFGCQLGTALWTWMIFAIVLSIFGYIIVLPLSYGNSPYYRTPKRIIISILLAIIYSMYVTNILLITNR